MWIHFHKITTLISFLKTIIPKRKPGTREHTELERNELLLTHMLFIFIASALSFIVPLYLLDIGIDISLIGFILAMGPISFLFVRIFLASIADDIGTKSIAVGYSLLNAMAAILYSFVISPLGFAAAAVFEGVRNSGFWAIARTETFEFNGNRKKPGIALARFADMRQLADGLGRLAAGAVLAYFAFTGAFNLVMLLSAFLIILALISTERGLGGLHIDKHLLKRIFKNHPPSFWHTAVLIILLWVPHDILPVFLLPIFMASKLNLGYAEIGLLLAIFSIASAAFALIFTKLRISNRKLILLTGLGIPALLLFPYSIVDNLVLLLVLALSKGCALVVNEYLLTDQVCRSKDISTDVAVLNGPLQIASFLFLALGGITIAHFGFLPLFALMAISLTLFVIVGNSLLKGTIT